MFTSITRKSLIVATALLAVPLAGLPAAGVSQAAYNFGVEYVDLSDAPEECHPEALILCTPGGGVGVSHSVTVTQSTVDGHHRFNGLETTSPLDDHVWFSVEIGAGCRWGYSLFYAEINTGVSPEDGRWGILPDEVDDSYHQEISVPNAQEMPVKRVAFNVPIEQEFAEAVFAEGEAEIQRRVDAGATPAEARGLAYDLIVPQDLGAKVICRGNGGAHIKYVKTANIVVPLTVHWEPVEVGAPVGDQTPPVDGLIAAPAVTDLDLFVIQDPADPCTLHLSGSIHANQPMNVEYRFINPHGQPSNTYNVAIDATLSALVDRTVAVPMLDVPDPTGDLAVVGGHGDLDDFFAEVPTDQYSGTYMIEVISPNHMLDADGFAVDYCDTAPVRTTEIAGHAADVFTMGAHPTHG